ncbi:hypothetical protein IKD98_00135 [Candidatus Saccharibacteria bacterium]|nr:hypothetical protein [Candidatus Saccharibacteria bacterium]
MVKKRKGFRYLALLLIFFPALIFIAPRAKARPGTTSLNTIAKINLTDEGAFAQNQIIFYNPNKCGNEGSKICTHEPIYSEPVSSDDVAPNSEVDGSKITFLGDSLIALGTESIFNEYFEGADYGNEWNQTGVSNYIRSGRGAIDVSHPDGPGGIVILRDIVKRGALRPILVFHLGANYGKVDTIMDELLELVGSDTQVVFITNYFPECYYNQYGSSLREFYSNQNDFLKQTAKTHDNVTIGDWASFAKDEWYNQDCIHHKDISVSKMYFKFIANTIASIDNEDCKEAGYLPGDTVAEKVWNWLTDYFNEQDIPNVSVSAVASGIMGNLITETGINPFLIGSNQMYYGMHMLMNPYGSELMNKVNDVIGTDYWYVHDGVTWWKDETDVDALLASRGIPESAIDTAIDESLKYYTVLQGGCCAWGEFMDGVKNWGVADTPKGYSDLFLVTMERAVNGDTPIEDPGVQKHYSGNYQGAEARRQNAQNVYDKYSTLASSSKTTEKSHTSNGTKYSSSISWDSEGWITGGMEGFNKDPAPSLGTTYNSGKPNKILLHYTQGGSGGGLGIYSNVNYAPHFTIDLPKRTVWQHRPLSVPSGAVIDSDDVRDIVQIEISGYGFLDDNPDNPGPDSRCLINGVDYTSSDYCFAHFTNEDWDYLANLLTGISKWGQDNGADIPLTTEVGWTGNVPSLRMSASDFDAAKGIVAHMHAPDNGNHSDTGNIWPFVEAAISRVGCSTDANPDEISGAKNADKNAEDVGAFWFSDSDTSSMKTDLENYGDLAFRTGNAYGIPWVAIVVQGRYEDSGRNGFDHMCGKNNFWGIACYNGSGAGEGANLANLGEGFTLYGKTVHNGRYEKALEQTDPYKFIEELGKGCWRVSYEGVCGYDPDQLANMKNSIDALQAFIDSPEGQAVVAEFGAAGCDSGSTDECVEGEDQSARDGDVLAAVELIIGLANKNGSTYTWGGGHISSGQEQVFDDMLNGAPINVDCTGFASLVMYKAYGKLDPLSFASMTIQYAPDTYEKIDRSKVRPGDIFVYNSPSGHGGIVIEASNGVVTKIAETGGWIGQSGANTNIGYSEGAASFSITNMNGPNGEFYRYKGAKK